MVSHIFLPAIDKADFYPFYNWNIFSITRSRGLIFTIELKQADGVIYDPPLLYYGNPKDFGVRNSYLSQYDIRNFGEAILARASFEDIENRKKIMENNIFFKFKKVSYRLIYADINYRKLIMNPSNVQFLHLASYEIVRE